MISVFVAGSPSGVSVPIRDTETEMEDIRFCNKPVTVDLGVVYIPALGADAALQLPKQLVLIVSQGD